VSNRRGRAGVAVVVLFYLVGAVLLAVSCIHFAVTGTLVRHVLDGHIDAGAERIARASFLLNHLVVGVLLVPLGLSTMFAAGGIREGDRLARRIGWSNAIAVLALPVVIAGVMGRREMLDGGPFSVAVGLVVLAAVGLIGGMCLTMALGASMESGPGGGEQFKSG
jgi:hypothetical protein